MALWVKRPADSACHPSGVGQMSSNPLMMGYESGDLLLLALPANGQVAAQACSVHAVGGGLVGRRLWSVTRAH